MTAFKNDTKNNISRYEMNNEAKMKPTFTHFDWPPFSTFQDQM